MSGARVRIRREIQPNVLPGSVTQYRVHVGTKIYGPVRHTDFRRIPGFTLKTPVALYGSDQWKPAYQVINLDNYFSYSTNNSFSKFNSANNLKSQIFAGSAEDSPILAMARTFPRRRKKRLVLKTLLALMLVVGLSGTWNLKAFHHIKLPPLSSSWSEVGRTLQNQVSSAAEWALSTLEP